MMFLLKIKDLKIKKPESAVSVRNSGDPLSFSNSQAFLFLGEHHEK